MDETAFTLPLISCIMPTANRRSFVEQSITYFHAQDYPCKELIILDDGEDDISDLYKGWTNVGFLRSITQKWSIGAKRNKGCSVANGSIICHWDDDDYYGPQRLSKQVKPLLNGQADVSAMRMSLLHDLETNTYWQCSREEHKRLFQYDVRAGTLMYLASYWREGVHYPDSSRGEDVAFLQSLIRNGAALARIDDPDSYICVRHSGNTTDALQFNEQWKQVVREGVHV
jgi:glycosyltransferase involved in cell wall biosynthesis